MIPKFPYVQLLVSFLICAVFLSCSSKPHTISVRFQKLDGSLTPPVDAEIAQSPSEIQVGLMYRKTLLPEQGMLFVFPGEEPRSFWMKNTYLELDMVFVSAQKKIVSIINRAVPLTQTPRPSGAPAKYVLEVLGGSAQRWGIQPGDEMLLEGES